MRPVIGFVALGSNVGDRVAHLRAGVLALPRAGARVSALSSVWETEPVGDAGPAPFLNMVARVETELTPEDLLAALLEVERGRGRERIRANAPRELDLDLLVLGDLRRNVPALTLPHPRMEERRFVLAPLAELAPELVLAGSGRTVAEALAALADPHAARRIGSLYTPEGAPVYSPAS